MGMAGLHCGKRFFSHIKCISSDKMNISMASCHPVSKTHTEVVAEFIVQMYSTIEST